MTRTGRNLLRRALHASAALAGACLLALSLLPSASAQEESERFARLADFDGPVSLLRVEHIERVLADAETDGAEVVIVRLNTPGGPIDLTERLTGAFLESRVPIVVWVGPIGAHASSAGTFITLAGHLACMAPDTTIGAATPVNGMGGDLETDLRRKTISHLVATMENLAARRGTDAVAFAVAAVQDARTITAREALEIGVVDAISEDLDAVLADMDGREVSLRDRVDVVRTAGIRVEEVSFNLLEHALGMITNPTIAYILLLLGLGGLIYEFAVPGIGFAGVGGAICLLLGIYALGMLPVNYVGVALVLTAFALFIADVKSGAGGLVALGGVLALVLGGLFLFESPHFAVSISVLITSAVVVGIFFAFAGRAVVAIHRRKPTTGTEGLLGAAGDVRADLDPDGLVAVQGETWRATADDAPLPRGTRVRVTAVDGLHIRVKRAE